MTVTIMWPETNPSAICLLHVRSLSLRRTRVPGADGPGVASPRPEQSPGDASPHPASPQVEAAQQAGGNISKPTDAGTEKGGHDAERIDLTLWSLGTAKTRGERGRALGVGGFFQRGGRLRREGLPVLPGLPPALRWCQTSANSPATSSGRNCSAAAPNTFTARNPQSSTIRFPSKVPAGGQ